MSSRVLKLCANQLSYVFTVIFNTCFKNKLLPEIWKKSCIIPVPKKQRIQTMNDLRPIALTSVVMKVCEKIVLDFLKPLVSNHMDPLQFAYRSNRSTDDAILFSLEKIYSHLEHTRLGNSIRIMYFDFSSAFNTIQPHLLVSKLVKMNIPHPLIAFVFNFLTDRSQYVRLNKSTQSDVIVTNTGAPQGTVLAPFLFTLYTADCRSSSISCPLVKFADDTMMLGLVKNDNETHYRAEIDHFIEYCDNNYLELNVSKTKEMVIDFRRNKKELDTIVIKNIAVEQVSNYKYLGVVFDNALSWGDHVDYIMKKLNSRMYCLRKLNSFNVRNEILSIFYKSVICGVWNYCLVGWGGNIVQRDRDRLDRFIRRAERMIGSSQQSVDSVYHDRLCTKYHIVIDDSSHPLHSEFADRTIQRSGRLRLPTALTNRHPRSFIPRAIKYHNSNFKR